MVATNDVFSIHHPRFEDVHLLKQIQEQLSSSIPLVSPMEVKKLTKELIKAFHQQSFIIQLGDCAERFSEAEPLISHLKYKQLNQAKLLIEEKINRSVIMIGRIAGQYAKPRSNGPENINGKLIYPYYGDMINSEYISESRNPDPYRILQAYHASKKIISHLKKFENPVYTSHECFLLEYEYPLTRKDQEKKYNLSTHLPWLGMRSIISKPHINYLSTIHNPIAIKIGADTPISTMISTIKQINSKNKIGKIVLILRLGKNNVHNSLPKLIEAVHENNLNVIWMNDPLHGNTKKDQYEKKYRLVDDAIEETVNICHVLFHYGIHLSGLHLEASYKSDILECVNSLDELTENRLYNSAVDPRLNNEQCTYFLEKVLNPIRLFFNEKKSA
jgi:3-deoxy-7-phosphoheptulonate synthase